MDRNGANRQGTGKSSGVKRNVTKAGSVSKQAAKAQADISEIRRRQAARRRLEEKRRKQRLVIFAGAALLLVAALVIILAVNCGGSNDDIQQTLSATSTPSTYAGTGDEVSTSPSDNPSQDDNLSDSFELGNAYTAQQYIQSLTPGATAQPEVYLEVIKYGPTNNKRIAVTVDDLNEVSNLNQIIQIARNNGAKLTLFAIGSVIDHKETLQQTLVTAYQLGYEIENHTYNHDREMRVYSLSDEDMAYQIYMTEVAVNKALGFKYEMHFIRLPGGNGEYDLRTHQYLIQLGNYKAIAHWSYSGSDMPISKIEQNLKPGYIYLFHCKDKDLEKLREFIPYAVSQGYELVTLNELLGYPENEVSRGVSVTNYEIPAPKPFVYQTFLMLGRKTDTYNYTQLYAVQILQNRLIELGYLSSSALVDGDYGSNTKRAVEIFQSYNNLDADGIAGPATQELLFSSNARYNPSGIIAGEEITDSES